ncbi:vitrin [Rhinichthys klamathensis goyatoka]|uniref:vitrin n=1 Tax=Rhinichthys klamathensis goyatoka TaxID=3034132 RepID=UPI0024B5AB53|nr:vitrin [Rhinichthys klamathensis goyatoka]
MSKSTLTAVFIAFLLTSSGAKPNGKNKKQKQVVPAIECEMRSGKINLPEFIVKCPGNCRESKEKVYGTGVFASISSICNAAIHSGVISNSGGKVIVMKSAGQPIYKGSFANGIRSLSLPNWRESFSVSVGKPKKGVIYPSTLVFVHSRPIVKPGESKELSYFPVSPVTEAPEAEPSSTTAPPTTTPVTTPTTTAPPTTTPVTTPTSTAPPTTTSAKPRATVHKVREAGSSHPYFSSVARQSQSAQGKGPTQAFRGSSVYANRFLPRTNTGVQRPELSSTIRRQPHVPSASALSRVQPQSERKQHTPQSNPTLVRRDWTHPAYARPDWFSGTRRPTGIRIIMQVHPVQYGSHSVPNTGHTWSRTSPADPAALDPAPGNTEHQHHYHFGQFSPEPEHHKPPPATGHSRETPAESNPFDSGFNARGHDSSLARAPELSGRTRGDPNCKVDIAFLMDGSWSIGKRRFKIQKDFLVEVSQALNVGAEGAMMGIIQYGDDAVTEFSLKQFSSSSDVKPAISKITQKGGLSHVGKALSYINKHFFSDANGNRGGAPNVAVVLVDGWPTDRVEEASRLARESGINIFFVTIEGPDDNEKQNVVEANFVDKAVCRTNGFYSLPIASWFALRKAVQPLVKRVCDTDRLMCSKTCLNANDIAFVIDGSSSVGTGNFRTVLQFVANVTREFEISDTDTRVGIVQYTYEQRLEFAFGQHNNKADLLNAIKRINYWSGGTSTGAAITYAADQLFSKSKPNKRKIMIVITDGRSYDDVRAPALAVHRKGVIAYSIGIAWAAQDELEYIATDPDREHSFFVDEFDNLYKYVSKIIHNICNEFNSQPRN